MPAVEPTGAPTSPWEAIADLFDRAVAGYYLSLDAQEWTLVWEFADLLDTIHALEEQVAA